MLYYDRIDFSEGVDANKKSTSRKCMICHYLYFFLYKVFNFQPAVCNGFHDVFELCRCIINEISKSDAINVLQNSDLNEKTGSS